MPTTTPSHRHNAWYSSILHLRTLTDTSSRNMIKMQRIWWQATHGTRLCAMARYTSPLDRIWRCVLDRCRAVFWLFLYYYYSRIRIPIISHLSIIQHIRREAMKRVIICANVLDRENDTREHEGNCPRIQKICYFSHHRLHCAGLWLSSRRVLLTYLNTYWPLPAQPVLTGSQSS
jgi:hypothetical protein